MKQIHIAWFSQPQHPHVNPTLPVVGSLVRRGFRVTYVTAKLFGSRVAALGAEVVYCPLYLDIVAKAQKSELPRVFCQLATEALTAVTEFYENDKPDLIICDFVSFAGRILANRWKIPLIQTSPHFAFSREYLDRQMTDSAFRREILHYSAQADRFLEQHGVHSDGFLFHREKLNIHFFPRIFEPCDDALDTSVFHAGRCAGEQPYYGNWERTHDDGRPIALITTSTTYLQGTEHLKLCIEALAGLEWHVVLSVGYSGETSGFPALPPGFEIVQRQPHVKILRHATLFVCLGGTCSIAEGAYHGVPTIITSYDYPEQSYFGERFESLGLAVHLRKGDMTAENLRRAALRITHDSAFLDRVSRIRRITQQSAGGEETSTKIEEFLEQHGVWRMGPMTNKPHGSGDRANEAVEM